MNREKLEEIFSEAGYYDLKGDNVFEGFLIINKYIDHKNKNVIRGVGHDIIYSVDIDEILELGLTKEDAEALAKLNWMLEDRLNCFSCFV